MVTRVSLRKTEAFSLKKTGEGKTVFITGGGGRVGRSLARALVRKGYTVRALSHNKEFVRTMPAGVVPYVADITNKKILSEACKGVDLVFHLAAVVSEYKVSTQKLMEVNVTGTRNVLEAARLNGVGHVIFTSSVDVYGHARKEPLTEESELKPNDKYGYSKMLAEQEMAKFQDKVDYTILRMAAIYGRGFEGSYFKLFKAIREGKAYLIGSGKNHLALIHIEDVINAFIMAAENVKESRNLYNLSDGYPYTQAELFNMVADILKVERPKKHISPIIVNLVAKNRGLDSDELRFLMSDRIIDIGKVKKDLGFKPSVGIQDAGLDMLSDFLSRQK